MTPTRLLYWSVRRELWENRSIYIAPAVVAALALAGFLISAIRVAHNAGDLAVRAAAQSQAEVRQPYHFVAFLMVVTTFLVGVFYCLDALHGERRDRSILFWKSLPVSDLTTVLSKAGVPMVILPLLVFALTFGAQSMMLMLSSGLLTMNGLSAVPLLRQLEFGQSSIALFYALTTIALWHAPIYAWLLLVSSWARRTALLWALLPPVGVCIVEKIAFNSAGFAALLQYRLAGWYTQGFYLPGQDAAPVNPLATLAPAKLLSTPGLWTGLVFTVLCLAGATRMRRSRGPI